MNGQWERIGNFNRIQNLGWNTTSLNRHVTFKNNRPDNHIKEFFLGKYQNGSFQVVIKASNRQSYEQLKLAVVQPGIEEPDFSDNDMNNIRLTTTHLGLIGKFLNSLESVEPSFASVKHDVCTTLAIDPNQDYSVPIWLIEGNFNQTQHFGPGTNLNRTLTFKNTRLSHCIKQLELFGYRDGTFDVVAQVRNDQNLQQLSQAMIEAGLQAPDSTDRMLKHVTLKNITLVTYSQPLNNFINAIQTVLPEIEMIRQDISNAFQNLAAHAVSHLPAYSFAPLIAVNPLLFLFQDLITEATMNASFENSHHSASNPPPPDVGTNQNRVEELQKKYEAKHKSKIEIPEKFLCALMNSVMTTPVSVPQTPNVRFEQSQILHWLTSNPSHPLTRAPLNPQQLIVDKELQQEIEQFINAEENKLDEPTVEPVVEPSTAEPAVIIHAFKKRIRTTELERLREEANNFTGGELPAKRKRSSRITH